jgi:aryl-alcohol dehydrogenase-like predicted oxidoreductase
MVPQPTIAIWCSAGVVMAECGGSWWGGAIAGARYDYRTAPPDVLRRVAAIDRVCAAHGVALAHAALSFVLGHPAVSSVVRRVARRGAP